MSEKECIVVRNDLDIITARVAGRNMAAKLNFSTIDQARVATAISELARNIVLYAGEGKVTLLAIENNGSVGLEIICTDEGPGIANVTEVLEGKVASTKGLGMGLPGAKRLMDEFEVASEVGVGTTVTARKWLK